MNAVESLEHIADEVHACTICRLHSGRKNAVPGEGPGNAELLFVGEGPGFHENEQGRPFVGAAGKLLEELLATIALTREDVFICNVVKCRPPGNRDPQADEIDACSSYLERQIKAINPKAIITLGRFSMARYFPNARISAIHGQAQRVDGRFIISMYHPAAALHQPSLRAVIMQDFARIPGYLDQGLEKNATTQEPPEEPQQLSLF